MLRIATGLVTAKNQLNKTFSTQMSQSGILVDVHSGASGSLEVW